MNKLTFTRALLITASSLFVNAAFGQITLKGFLKDTTGTPIEGASILVKGSNAFTIADSKGGFTLSVKKEPPYTLRITSVGYQFEELQWPTLVDSTLTIILKNNTNLTEVVVTSRRRMETAQNVPIPVTVISGGLVEDAGAFNVNRIKEMVPTVQLYSSNPRNTTLNVRGLGSTFGLTNDGVDPGVGFYIDGVYYARPAATALDFIDIQQVEILRGPQGTLFGKNTTAGAFNITTRQPSFTPAAKFEVSYGNFGYIQAKTSVTGPLGKKLAGRISFSGTQRDGLLYNVATQKDVNDINNLGFRGQLLYTPTDKIKITFVADATRQRPNGYAQVIAGVVQTQRPAYRQFNQIIADLNYQVPSMNPFDRLIDHNTPWQSQNDFSGASVNIDAKILNGTLTATTAWRSWYWGPSNDRDFTGLPVLTLSQATSKHTQWTQEVRYAGDFSTKLSGVIGVFFIGQDLWTAPVHIEESGSAQWRFSQSTTSEKWKTPGLFDGYGIKTNSRLRSFGAAVFGQLDWAITKSLHLLPGLRFNYDEKDVNYDRKTYGGLQTSDPELIALKNLVYSNQSFVTRADERNISGQLTLAFRPSDRINSFVTYSTSYKPIGVNLGGLPSSGGKVMIELARIKPESVRHFEVGLKTKPSSNSTLNLVVHNTNIEDYQTQVQTAEVGVNRGYLANAGKVNVRGAELDAGFRPGKHLSFYAALAYTDGKYVSFTNAPVPLEETGGPAAFKDISGGKLPGISTWAGSFGSELVSIQTKNWGSPGEFFFAVDGYYRSGFSSSPSPSAYLNIDGYMLLNSRVGFRATKGLSWFFWARNIFNKDYFEQLLPAAGNAGHYAAVIGDPGTFGITLRYAIQNN